MAAPLAATLGPVGRAVVVDSFVDGTHPPEILDDAATIARRVIELPDRYVNAGAMLMRHLAWHVRETHVGDGSATAAVLAREMIRGGVRMIAAGANPAVLRRGMERGVRAALDELTAMAQPLDSEPAVVGLARAVTGDPELSDLLAEIFDVVGVDGTIVVQNYLVPLMDREYVEGIQWDSGLASTEFVTDARRQETVMKNPVIAMADMNVTGAQQVLPVLEQAIQAGAESLVIIAEKFEGDAIGALWLNRNKLASAPIRAPKPTLQRAGILKDLAILTGGTVIDEKAGRQLESIRSEDFGRARRVVATRHDFTIVGAKGRHREIRRRMAELKDELAEEAPSSRLDTLRRRLANLSGGVAILRIGAISDHDRKLKREKVEDAIRAVRVALQEGTVAGGGAAYLACVPALEALEAATDHTEEAMGVRVVAEALAAPMKQIATNAGYPGSTMAAKARAEGPGHGFDALSGEVVDMREADIVDPAKVQCVALDAAASMAAMVLTTDAVVLTKRAGMQDAQFEP
jgi:chaperonin GroEL